MDTQEVLGGLIQELRRGTLILSVLSQLSKPQYGYNLVSALEEKGISIDPGTLYPLLRRLEKQGLLESVWDTNEARPRKYYQLSPMGQEVYRLLCKEWESLSFSLNQMLSGGHDDGTR